MNLKQYNLLRLALLFFILAFFIFTLANEKAFINSINGYLILASIFLVNRLSFVTIANFFPKKYQRQDNPYTVLLPVKNEEPTILNKAIEMLLKQNGTKQILVGDDGSSPRLSEVIKPEYLSQIELIRSEGVGKKEMQLMLIEKAKYDYAIQMDSDIILEGNDALKNLVGYFSKSNSIGIINGKIKLISGNRLIEKLQEFQYMCANEIGRSGMGRFGINPCATGELMAFRLDVFKHCLEEYKNTTHIDNIMKFGEDRFMTNIFLRMGFKSIVAEEVVCYTYPKKEFKTLLKQQKRWKLSGIRESLRCFREVRNPYLKVWSILNFVLPMLFFLLFLNLLIFDVYYRDWEGVLLLFSSLITISLVSETPILIKKPSMIIWAVPFMIYNILFITPLWFISAFSQTEVSWGTR